MTCTSPTLRHMSRIYLDLKSIHCQTISGLNPDRPVPTMDPETRVSQRPAAYVASMSILRHTTAHGFVLPTLIFPWCYLFPHPRQLLVPGDYAPPCEIHADRAHSKPPNMAR